MVVQSLADRNLIGRCGLYCGACGIYRAYKDGGEYRQRLAIAFKCPVEKVCCEGCQALTKDCWGNGCEIVKCLNRRKLQFCFQCSEFESYSCKKFEEFSREYLKDDCVDLRANSARIKAGAIEEWLKESAEKFRCPYCSKPLPTASFRSKCYHCDKELTH